MAGHREGWERASAIFAFALAAQLCAQEAQIPEYRPAAQVAGTIRMCGSPQMGELLKLYEAGFMGVQPQVQFENDLESTVTAVAGVASGRAEIGLLGREIWPKESAEFAKTRGHAPLVIDIATGSYDVPKATFALMVFVPAANPIASVSLAQLKSTFAAGDGTIHTWGELGLDGEWAARPIHLYGFAVDNDKSQIFRQLVFGGSQSWSPRLKEFSNAGGRDAGQLIVNAVANDPGAIGISNVHYATDSVRALAVSGHADPRPIPPTRENVKTRKYPLTRAVYMVVDADASDAMNPARREFLRYVLSRQGEAAVLREGNYLPLPATIAQRELDSLSMAAR